MNSKKTRGKTVKTLNAMARKPFLVFCGLFCISLLASAALYLGYRTIFISSEKSAGSSAAINHGGFEASDYQDVFFVWQEKERQFNEADGVEYPDIFR